MRRLVVAVYVVLSVAVLAGCGGSKSTSNGVASKSADQIVAAAKAAASSATSVHAYGSGSDNGVPLVINLHIVAGKGGKGSLSEHGLSFQYDAELLTGRPGPMVDGPVGTTRPASRRSSRTACTVGRDSPVSALMTPTVCAPSVSAKKRRQAT